jgi:hypothetical protein
MGGERCSEVHLAQVSAIPFSQQTLRLAAATAAQVISHTCQLLTLVLCRWLRLPLTALATGGCLLTVYDSLASENERVHQPRTIDAA